MQAVRRVLDHYNIEYEDIKAVNAVSFLCPFHNDNNLGSARFDEDNEVYYCFSCGEGGNIYQFVSKMEPCDIRKAQTLIENDFSDNVYDLVTLKVRLERSYDQSSKNKEDRKMKEAILLKFYEILPPTTFYPQILAKWYSIFVFMSTGSVSQSNMLDLYEKYCIDIREEVVIK